MKRSRLPLLLVAILGVLWTSAASADMCLGGGGYHPPDDVTAVDASPPDGDAAKAERTEPRMLGAAFLLAACVSTGWLVLRRKD